MQNLYARPLSIRANVAPGLVVGVVALPLSLALAVAVGVNPVVGLYTAAFAGLTAAVFGGSEFNVTGPTAALVPLLAHVVLVHGPGALPMVAVMSGVLLLLMSALHFGRVMRFMPGLVVTGFTAGIAVVLAFGQLNAFLAVTGTDSRLEHFHERALDTLAHLGTVSPTTPLLGVGVVLLLVSWPRVRGLSRVPGPLVALVGTTLLVHLLGIETPTLADKYGVLSGAFPVPTLAFLDVSVAWSLLPAAASVAALGAVESLLSAVVADSLASADVRHDPDRELLGQGLANIVSPIMGGMPATAAIARTATGIRSGATSRVSAVVHSLTVLAATLVLAPWAGLIPLTALAAVLLVVAWNIAEVPEVWRLLRRAPRDDLVVLVSTVVITVFLDLTYAIAFGVAVSVALLLRKLVALPAAQELLPDPTGRIRQVTPELGELLQSRPDVTVFSLEGLLSFHSAAAFEYELWGSECESLVLRMKDVRAFDTTGLLTLEGVIEHRQRRGKRTMLSAAPPHVLEVLERFGILDLVGRDNVFSATWDAVNSVPLPFPGAEATTSHEAAQPRAVAATPAPPR